MKTTSWLFRFLVRFTLFTLVLGLGLLLILAINEQAGLASPALPVAPIQSLARADDVLYANVLAATDGTPHPIGLYRSVDGGYSWQYASAGPGLPLQTLAVHPGNAKIIYAATLNGPAATDGNLWQSLDAGQSWQQFYLTLPASPDGRIPDVTALAVDPQRPDEFYAGTAGQGIYRYQARPSAYGYELFGGVSLPYSYIKELVVGPDSTVYALTSEGLLAIDETGQTWRTIATLPDLPVSLAVDPTNPQTLYAGTVGYGAYRSDDGGQTWQTINEGLGWQPGVILRGSAIAIDQTNPQHLALATAYNVGSHLVGDGVYESANGGQTWNKLGASSLLVKHLQLKEGGIYASTTQGLIHYGEPSVSLGNPSLSHENGLPQLSGLQILILGLTLLLAGLILVGRVEWFLQPKQAS